MLTASRPIASEASERDTAAVPLEPPDAEPQAEHRQRVGRHIGHEARRGAKEPWEGDHDDQRHEDCRPVADKPPRQKYVDMTAEQAHDQPECRERPRVAARQPQQRLHQDELPDRRGRVPRHVEGCPSEQVLGAAHVDPVVVCGDTDGARGGRQPEGNADADQAEGRHGRTPAVIGGTMDVAQAERYRRGASH